MKEGVPGRLRGALLLTVCLFALPAALPGEPRYGGTLVLSTLVAPQGLDPGATADSISVHVDELAFDSLIHYDGSLRVVPGLAESWEVSADGLAWTFHLRRGVRFQDGRELTSADVLFTYNRILNPALRSPYASQYALVERFEAPDPHTVRVRLREPYASLPYRMNREIVPAHLFRAPGFSEERFSRHPVGSGPWRVIRWTDAQVEMAANPDYYAGRPYLDRLIIRFFPDRVSAWSALLQGKVDAVEDLDFRDYRVLQQDPRYEVYNYLDGFYYTLLFNLEDPLLADPELRRALDLAVDRSDLIARALQGHGVPATGPFLPGSWPANPAVETRFDPREAARILERLGWRDRDGDGFRERDGRPLQFTLLLDRGDSIKTEAARRLRWQLLQVGVRLELQALDRLEFMQGRLLPGHFQAALLQFTVGVEPDAATTLFWHSRSIGRTNLARYRSAAVDGLLDRARVAMDPAERERLYREVHARIAADRPALFLFFRRKFVGVSARFGGVKVPPAEFYRSLREWHIKSSGGAR